jgi:dipeptidyl aminopeptidase/acylaminoacyl peptidase
MRHLRSGIAMLTMLGLALTTCTPPSPQGSAGSQQSDGKTFAQARAGISTRLLRQTRDGTPVPSPPDGVFDLIHYPAPSGSLSAYLTQSPATPGKHPAIVWITGGDSNTIGDVWSPQPPDNDQSAAAYREAGIVVIFPSLRGGNDNPGVREAFYGEVQDILASADYLATLDYVDPQRIYLGGHSTDGTLALLVAESDPRFRATFAFGPVYDVSVYGPEMLPVTMDDAREIRLRSPGYWLSSIRSPVYVFEGDHDANTGELERMRSENHDSNVEFFVVPRADHFSTLAPVNALIARKILADTGTGPRLRIRQDELSDLNR